VSRKGGEQSCSVCTRLSPVQLLELDSIIGDPACWPVTIWGMFEPPKGGLPASYRRFGAVRMGRQWLDANDYRDITDGRLRMHIRYDVVHVARDPSELVTAGIIARSTALHTRIPTAPALDASAFIRYFNSGIQMGEAAQRLLAERINMAIEAGEIPDAKLVMKLADMGAAFARTQASLMAKGMKFGQDEDDDDAFRGSEETLPGPRIGHNRVRVVDGERRPVLDQGPADRERHRRRAEQEGSEGLG
jgi:hypothetical protein